MTPRSLRLRQSLVVAALLASCVHSLKSLPPVTEKLSLSETASGPHGKAPLAIAAAGPRGEIPLDRDPGITVVFTRPMRKLDAPVYRDLPDLRITTKDGAPIAGQFRFLGTRGLLFKPAQALPGATSFRLLVPAGTTSVDGSKLAADYTLEFSTVRPELTMAFPSERPLRAKEPVYLQFSLPVEPAEVAARLELVDELSGKPIARAGELTVERGTPDWAMVRRAPEDELENYEPIREISDPSGKWVKVTPKAPLPADGRFRLVIGKGLLSKAGPLRTDAAITVPIRSLGPLRLVNATCARQNLGRCEAHRDFGIVLSNPVAPGEFRRFLSIKGPKRDAKPNTGAKPKKVRFALEHPLRLDPDYGDRFRVTLRAGMTDVFGQKLDRDVNIELAVEDPYRTASGTPPVVTTESTPTYETSDGEAATPSDATTPRRPRLEIRARARFAWPRSRIERRSQRQDPRQRDQRSHLWSPYREAPRDRSHPMA
ncbi:MAG: Ig-like domain-containing protein [Polyangiaceae bacterium]